MIQVLHIIQSPDNPNWTLLKDLSKTEIRQVILQTAESQPSAADDNYLQTIEADQVQPADFRIIHAHSWMTDGAIAWEHHQKLGLPYCVSLTEEDIHYARKMSLKMHSDRLRILQDAAKVIFPHPQFFHAFNQALSDNQANGLFSKTITIFRSIDPLFLQQLSLHKPVALVHTRLLYIVQHPEIEDEISLIAKAMKEIQHQNLDISLTVAAKELTEKDKSKIERLASVQLIRYQSPEALLNIYRDYHIAIMVGEEISFTCHYAEALSQGMPVIFSRNSCLDGLLDNNMFRIEKESSHLLAEKIIEISQRYATAVQHISELHPLLKFNGSEIAQEHLRVYSISDSLHQRGARS